MKMMLALPAVGLGLCVLGVNDAFAAATELYSTPLYSDANLVYYWRFEGNSNTTVGSNNGSDTNVGYGAGYGKFGQGAYINGASSKITLPNGVNLKSGSWSYSFWTYLTTMSGTSWMVLAPTTTGGMGIVIDSAGSITVWSADYWGVRGGCWTSKAGMVAPNKWYLVTVTSDTTSTNFYAGEAGGTLVSDTNVAYTVIWGNGQKSSLNCTIMGTDIYGNSFVGYIDDVAYFNRILTGTEIQNLYSGFSSPTPTITPTPPLTCTPYPTYTPYPTTTPYPTQTPNPTYTPYPTQTPTMAPTPTATNAPTGTPTITPTPAPTTTPGSPGTPGAGTRYTLSDIYDYLSSGTTATIGGHSLEPPAGAFPGDFRFKTLNQIYDDIKAKFDQCDLTPEDAKAGKKFFSTIPGSWGVQVGTGNICP